MEKINFLPGPVCLHRDILKDVAVMPFSHRSEEFKDVFAKTRAALCKITKSKNCAILVGSGTLANEVIAANLTQLKGKGLIITNGEFGCRLAEQAARFALKFKRLDYAWGQAFDYEEVASYIGQNKPAWVWFVHLETSTGVLNDYAKISALCAAAGSKLCLDVISTIGNMPLDLSRVYLASASSGKGLVALAGLAMVFCNHLPQACDDIPKYMDLGFYLSKQSLPFTLPSSLLMPLYGELKRTEVKKRSAGNNKLAQKFKKFLAAKGFKLIGNAPYVITAVTPQGVNSQAFGDYMLKNNIAIHYKNDYLKQRGWIQLAFMGYHKADKFEAFVKVFNKMPR